MAVYNIFHSGQVGRANAIAKLVLHQTYGTRDMIRNRCTAWPFQQFQSSACTGSLWYSRSTMGTTIMDNNTSTSNWLWLLLLFQLSTVLLVHSQTCLQEWRTHTTTSKDAPCCHGNERGNAVVVHMFAKLKTVLYQKRFLYWYITTAEVKNWGAVMYDIDCSKRGNLNKIYRRSELVLSLIAGLNWQTYLA